MGSAITTKGYGLERSPRRKINILWPKILAIWDSSCFADGHL